MKIYIKYMVSPRCKLAVTKALNSLGMPFVFLEMGELNVKGNLSNKQIESIRKSLLSSGLELMVDKKVILIEKIKTIIIDMIHHSHELLKMNFSDYLSKRLNHNYTYLASAFSQVQGMTIEQFIISHKVERIKELIIYDEMNITEISAEMHYSSVAHLSNQFKKATGYSPMHFKNLKIKQRQPIEDIGRFESELQHLLQPRFSVA